MQPNWNSRRVYPFPLRSKDLRAKLQHKNKMRASKFNSMKKRVKPTFHPFHIVDPSPAMLCVARVLGVTLHRYSNNILDYIIEYQYQFRSFFRQLSNVGGLTAILYFLRESLRLFQQIPQQQSLFSFERWLLMLWGALCYYVSQETYAFYCQPRANLAEIARVQSSNTVSVSTETHSIPLKELKELKENVIANKSEMNALRRGMLFLTVIMVMQVLTPYIHIRVSW